MLWKRPRLFRAARSAGPDHAPFQQDPAALPVLREAVLRTGGNSAAWEPLNGAAVAGQAVEATGFLSQPLVHSIRQKAAFSICRDSHSRPFRAICMLNGNQVRMRAGIQPTSRWVVVQHVTRPRPLHDAFPSVLQRRTWFHGADRAHQAAGDPALGGNLAGHRRRLPDA
jgi:hypothetical protein